MALAQERLVEDVLPERALQFGDLRATREALDLDRDPLLTALRGEGPLRAWFMPPRGKGKSKGDA